MTWLSEHKKKFDQEEVERLAKERKEEEDQQIRRDSASRELVRFVETVLHDLVGKKTKDGKLIRLELDKDRNNAIVYAGNEKFLDLYFWYTQNEKYDNDGCSWGDGIYYLNRQVIYYRPHNIRGGYNADAGKYGSLYDVDLAHYLLIFIDLG